MTRREDLEHRPPTVILRFVTTVLLRFVTTVILSFVTTVLLRFVTTIILRFVTTVILSASEGSLRITAELRVSKVNRLAEFRAI